MSVDSLRVPITSATGTPYSPAANDFGIVPGITTERGSTKPLVMRGSVLAHVDDRRRPRNDGTGAENGSRTNAHTFDDDATRTDKRTVFDDNGRGLRRLEYAADAHAAGKVHVLADLRARSDGGPGIDHRAFVDVRSDVDETGHQDRTAAEKTSVAGDAAGNAAHPEFLVVAFGRNLIVVRRRELATTCRVLLRAVRTHVFAVHARKVQQDRVLDPGMCDPALSVELRDAQQPLVERCDHLVYGLALLPPHCTRIRDQRVDPSL